MKIHLAAMLGLLTIASASAQTYVGNVDARWSTGQDPLIGDERKFFPGETLTLSVTGNFTVHATRRVTHCKVLGMFCDDVDEPVPQTYDAAQFPAQIQFKKTNDGTVLAGQIFVAAGNPQTVTIPGGEDSIDEAVTIVGFIPATNLDRGITTGRYDLTITVDENLRLALFRRYLIQKTPTASLLEKPGVLNGRLRSCCGAQVAVAIANTAQSAFTGQNDKKEDLLKLALSVDPGNTTVGSLLTQHYLQSGNFAGAKQAAKNEINSATDTDAKSLGFYNFALATEREWDGLDPNSLQDAATFYSQSYDAAVNSGYVSQQILSTVARGGVLRRVRSIESLKEAASAYRKAISLMPIEDTGAIVAGSSDDSYSLLKQVREGFQLVDSNGTAQSFLTSTEDRIPLGSSTDFRRVLVQKGGMAAWWDPNQPDQWQEIPLTAGHAVQIGKSGLITREFGGNMSLLLEDGSSRLLYKPPPPPAGGTVFAPTPPPLSAIAAKADMLAISESGAIRVERFDGTSVRNISLVSGDSISQLNISPDGAFVAAFVVGNGIQATHPRVRIWNTGDSSNGLDVTLNGTPFAGAFVNVETALSFSGDSKLVISDGLNLRIADPASHSVVNTIVLDSSPPSAAATPTIPGLPGIPGIPNPGTASGHVAVGDHAVFCFTLGADDAHSKSMFVDTQSMQVTTSAIKPDRVWSLVRPTLVQTAHGFALVAPAELFMYNVYSSRPKPAVVAKGQFSALRLAGAESVLDDGKKILLNEGQKVGILELATNAISEVSTGPGFAFSISAHGSNWRLLEGMPSQLKVRSFSATTENPPAFSPPPISQSLLDVYKTGGPCATALQPLWQPFFAGTDWMLVPSTFISGTPATTISASIQTYNLMSTWPPNADTRTISECGQIIALARNGFGVVVLPPWSPGNPPIRTLVYDPGVSGQHSTMLFSQMPGFSVPVAAFGSQQKLVAGHFDLTVSKTGAVGIWSISGNTVQSAPCAICSKMDVGSLVNLAESRKPKAPTSFPTFGPLQQPWLVSGSGNTLALVGTQRLFVQDVNTNKVRLRIASTLPIYLSDNLLLTQEPNQRLRFWVIP